MDRLEAIDDNLEISKINPPLYQLRTNIIVDDLVQSIIQHGLLQPLLVRISAGQVQLVCGQRRLEACKKIGLKIVPCQIVEVNDKQAFELSLTENLQRSSLDPLDEAVAFKKYVNEFGFGGVTDLAKTIGKSPTYVSRRIALLALPSEIKEELLRRRKSLSLALEMLSVDHDVEAREIVGQISALNLSSREVRRLIRRKKTVLDKNYFGDQRAQRLEDSIKAINRCIVSLKLALLRLDDAIESSDKNWLLRETLFQYRVTLHNQIDSLIRLKLRIQKESFRN